MMFMMPTPPTISDTPATEPSNKVMTVVMTPKRLRDAPSSCGLWKSSGTPSRRRCLWRISCLTSSCASGVRLNERASTSMPRHFERLAVDPLHDGRAGGQHDVVLVLPEEIGPFGLEHAEDHERNALDANRRADAIGGFKEVLGHGLAEHANLGRGVDVGGGEELAFVHLPIDDVSR